MNRIDWLIATGGNPCFELAALTPLLTGLVGETAAGIIGPALVGAGELGAGGAAIGGITGGGQGALRGLETGGLTGAGLGAGFGVATEAGLPITAGEAVGGALGGAAGGAATGQNPLLTGAAGGAAGLGAGLLGGGTGAAPTAPAAASTAMTPTPGAGPAAATTAIPGIGDGSSYSNILGSAGGLPGPLGNNPVVQTDVTGSLAQPGGGNLLPSGDGPTGTQLAGAPDGMLSPPTNLIGGGGASGGAVAPTQPGDPGGGGIDTSGWAPTTDARMAAGDLARGAWEQTPEGTAAAANAPEGGGTWQGIKDFLGNPSPLQLAGAGISGIGLISQLGNRDPYAAQIGQLQQQGTGAASMATALQSPTFTGIMPPGVQSSIDQQKRDATAAIRSSYASAGMAGSTSEAQQIAAENARIDAQKIGIEQNMLSQAAGYARLAPETMQQVFRDQFTSDQLFQNALNRFVQSLAGGRGGTTQPTGQSTA